MFTHSFVFKNLEVVVYIDAHTEEVYSWNFEYLFDSSNDYKAVHLKDLSPSKRGELLESANKFVKGIVKEVWLDKIEFEFEHKANLSGLFDINKEHTN
jgi:hypothetical protein